MRHRIVRHLPALVVAVGAVILGAVFLTGQLESTTNVARSLDDMNPLVRWCCAGFLLLGGAVWAVACLRWWPDLRDLWKTQQIGSSLTACGFGIYAIALGLASPGALITLVLTCTAGLTALAEFITAIAAERRIRRKVAAADAVG